MRSQSRPLQPPPPRSTHPARAPCYALSVEETEKNRLVRQIPSVDEMLSRPSARVLVTRHGEAIVTRSARKVIGEARGRALGGGERGGARPTLQSLDALLEQQVSADVSPSVRRVINASGVVLNTNLGRAPLASAAIEALQSVAEGYCNLELDLTDGRRGSRSAPLEPLLCELTGAEAAMVVNNCAGAVLLTLAALAQGKEAIVSRGELIEIGGGFRIPDAMTQSGVRLCEVGTTNKTRLTDYASAVGPETALLVKVHRSNFAMLGFTEEVSPRELAELAHSRNLLAYEDLGSGCLTEAVGERTVQLAVREGADVVTFSGDKLLGGPQAGLVVGKISALEKLKTHPLARALRVDKLTLVSLEATLRLYRDGREGEIPVLNMLAQTEEEVAARAERLRGLLASEGVAARVVSTIARVGGGALPLRELPSVAVLVPGTPAEPFAAALRAEGGEGTPVVGRIEDDELLLDLRAVAEADMPALAEAVLAGLRAVPRALPQFLRREPPQASGRTSSGSS